MDPEQDMGGSLDPGRHEHQWRMAGIAGAKRVLCRCECGEEIEAEADFNQWRGWYGIGTAEELAVECEEAAKPPPKSSEPA